MNQTLASATVSRRVFLIRNLFHPRSCRGNEADSSTHRLLTPTAALPSPQARGLARGHLSLLPTKNIRAAVGALFLATLFVACAPRAWAELSEAEAREYVKRGAVVVDVRTVEEFSAKHLTNVINIPLAEVKQQFPTVLTNKSDVVLLHCRTGRRSGMAEKDLRALGYTNVFNIGSFEKAQRILHAPAR